MKAHSSEVLVLSLKLLQALARALWFATRATAAFLQGFLTGEPAPPPRRPHRPAHRTQETFTQLFAVPETPEHPHKAKARDAARPVLTWDKYYGTVYADSEDIGDLSETPARRWQFAPYFGEQFPARVSFKAAWLDVMDYVETEGRKSV